MYNNGSGRHGGEGGRREGSEGEAEEKKTKQGESRRNGSSFQVVPPSGAWAAAPGVVSTRYPSLSL